MSKTVLVTGANRGIGLEVAKELAEQGHSVVVTARSQEKADVAADAIGGNVIAIPLDVNQDDSIASAAEKTKDRVSHLDAIINNAGILIDYEKKASDPDYEKILRTFETNTVGPMKVINAFLPLLKQGGQIVNVSSGMGGLTEMYGGTPGYRLSKVGLNAVTRMFATELKDRSIQVNSVCPGWVKTDMGGPNATRELAQGAETIVWLATEDHPHNGSFLRDKAVIDW